MANVLVTGCAGFIGYHLSKRLAQAGEAVVGVDNLNHYYDVNLKKSRLDQLQQLPTFSFEMSDIADRPAMQELFRNHRFDFVVHLAAQPGVRYSLENPAAYVDSNVVGFANVLEGCRHSQVKHLVFASSSSVYGANTKMPYSVQDNVDHPISLYAATKKANELMAHTYAHLFNLPCTGLRFFTVYGPWGRPDMALFKFTQAMISGEAIDVYNHGNMKRDFTYVDDIVEGIARVVRVIPTGVPGWDDSKADPSTSFAPYRVFNIGNHNPIELLTLIRVLEESIGTKAKLNFLPLQPGDVLATYADVSELETATGFRPQTPIEVGVKRFVDWYIDFYGAKNLSIPRQLRNLTQTTAQETLLQ